MKKRMAEMMICAYEQGYATDLRPMFKKPVTEALTYFALLDIILADHKEGR